MNEYLVFDIETNGLKPTEIFMICIMDLITRKRETYVGMEEVAQAIFRLSNARMVVGHFIKGFDLRIIKKFTDIEVRKEGIVDTLDMSRRYCPFLPNHKLATWGDLCDLPKLPSPLFETFTPEMIPYCERDVDVNTKAFDMLVELYIEQERDKQYYSSVLNEYIEAPK